MKNMELLTQLTDLTNRVSLANYNQNKDLEKAIISKRDLLQLLKYKRYVLNWGGRIYTCKKMQRIKSYR